MSKSNVFEFLHQSRVSGNVSAIKKLHAQLLRRGMLFLSHHLHTQLIATYAACLPNNTRQSLNNFFKCMNSTNPLHFNATISDFCRKGFPFLALSSFSFMHTLFGWAVLLPCSLSQVSNTVLAIQVMWCFEKQHHYIVHIYLKNTACMEYNYS